MNLSEVAHLLFTSLYVHLFASYTWLLLYDVPFCCGFPVVIDWSNALDDTPYDGNGNRICKQVCAAFTGDQAKLGSPTSIQGIIQIEQGGKTAC